MTSGRWIPLSPARKIIDDLMHFSRQVPVVTATRRFRLAEIAAARAACPQRPSWTALFLKAFALVAQKRPQLRRAFIPFPWPHLYEHPHSVGMFTIERQLGEEEIVVIAQQPRIDDLSLAEVDAFVRACQTMPLRDFPTWRRARRMTWLPRCLRRLVWWYGLNTSGAQRARLFGTFGLTSPAMAGAGMQNLLTPISSTIHYGLLEPDQSLDMRLTFDHRVYDGATAARALTDMETVLHERLLGELRARPQAA